MCIRDSFAALEQLTVDDLVRILKEPRNALVKQYQTLLSYDNVELEFDDEALQEIANKAIERKTGARGLRSIIEETMMDVMFEIPSQEDVKLVRITKEAVDGTCLLYTSLPDGGCLCRLSPSEFRVFCTLARRRPQAS